MSDKIEIDKRSGVETTGHEWDGIKELNTPSPRWWLMIFLASIIWSVGYWWVYPAWPTLSGDGVRGGTEGSMQWTQYKELSDSQAEIRDRKAQYMTRFEGASFEVIQNDPALYAFAIAGGRSAFKDNCATCHGTGGAGAAGYPNLNDDDWLWGGTPEAIEYTIRHGVRSADFDTRLSDMPAFGDVLSAAEVNDISTYVLAMGAGTAGTTGKQAYDDNCAVCHSENGEGNQDLGAPNLVDAIWFYGSSKQDIAAQIRTPKHGMMPSWGNRLDDATIRQLTVYVHSLGGGE